MNRIDQPLGLADTVGTYGTKAWYANQSLDWWLQNVNDSWRKKLLNAGSQTQTLIDQMAGMLAQQFPLLDGGPPPPVPNGTTGGTDSTPGTEPEVPEGSGASTPDLVKEYAGKLGSLLGSGQVTDAISGGIEGFAGAVAELATHPVQAVKDAALGVLDALKPGSPQRDAVAGALQKLAGAASSHGVQLPSFTGGAGGGTGGGPFWGPGQAPRGSGSGGIGGGGAGGAGGGKPLGSGSGGSSGGGSGGGGSGGGIGGGGGFGDSPIGPAVPNLPGVPNAPQLPPFTGGTNSQINQLLQEYRNAYDEGRAANEARYQQLLGGYGDRYTRGLQDFDQREAAQRGGHLERTNNVISGYGQLRDRSMERVESLGGFDRERIKRSLAQNNARDTSSMIGRGLYNTTVLDSAQRGNREDAEFQNQALTESLQRQRTAVDTALTGQTLGSQQLQSDQINAMDAANRTQRIGLDAQLSGDTLGVIERREDTYPNLTDIGNLMLQAGQNNTSPQVLPGYGGGRSNVGFQQPNLWGAWFGGGGGYNLQGLANQTQLNQLNQLAYLGYF